jgi:hypothetical protein
LLVEREAAGGQAGTSSRIENYLGFPNGISGDDLIQRAFRQAVKFGLEKAIVVYARGSRFLEGTPIPPSRFDHQATYLGFWSQLVVFEIFGA